MTKRREKNKQQPTFNKQLEPLYTKEKAKNETLMQVGKYFFSLSGMTYAGVILTVILDARSYSGQTLFYGFVAMICLGLLGLVLFERGSNDW